MFSFQMFSDVLCQNSRQFKMLFGHEVLAMTRIRTGIALPGSIWWQRSGVAGSCDPRRRPDGPEDANPMNRRLPAEVRGFVAENWDPW
jgi:hypothetical protein